MGLYPVQGDMSTSRFSTGRSGAGRLTRHRLGLVKETRVAGDNAPDVFAWMTGELGRAGQDAGTEAPRQSVSGVTRQSPSLFETGLRFWAVRGAATSPTSGPKQGTVLASLGPKSTAIRLTVTVIVPTSGRAGPPWVDVPRGTRSPIAHLRTVRPDGLKEAGKT